MKWVPALLWPVLQPRARGWGLVFLARVRAAVAGDAAAHDHPAPGAVRVRARGRSAPTTSCSSGRPCPGGGGIATRSRSCGRRSWREAAAFQLARARRWWAVVPRRARVATTGRAWTRLRVAIRRIVGLEDRRRRDRFATSPRRRVPRRSPGPASELVRPPAPDPACSRSGAAARGGSTTGRSVIAASP